MQLPSSSSRGCKSHERWFSMKSYFTQIILTWWGRRRRSFFWKLNAEAGPAPEKWHFFSPLKSSPDICWNHHPSERRSRHVFLRRASMDCEFMISRCEQHSQAVGTPSIYCELWIKMTTAFPWFMMRLCWNVMRVTTVHSYLHIYRTWPLQLVIQTRCAFCTTRSIFPLNSSVSCLH